MKDQMNIPPASQPVALVYPRDVYEYGPEGMPRVERMPDAVLDCIIQHSLFRYLGGALEGEDRDRLHGLMHDTANEVLARLPHWPVAVAPSDATGKADDANAGKVREGAWEWEQRAEAAKAFLRNYADANMEKLLGDYDVQPIIRRLANAILEWQQGVLRHAPEDVCGIDQSPATSGADAQDEAPSDAQIIAALHANGIDTYPSKHGFDAVQVSATSVPSLRNVLVTLATSAADAKDAARYRWIRARENNLDAVADGDTMLFGECLDHAIDTELAAIASTQQAAPVAKGEHSRFGSPELQARIIAHAQQAAPVAKGEQSAPDQFARGYFCAVAVLLREWGDANADVRSLFSQGGDPTKADPLDVELFVERGLMQAQSSPKGGDAVGGRDE